MDLASEAYSANKKTWDERSLHTVNGKNKSNRELSTPILNTGSSSNMNDSSENFSNLWVIRAKQLTSQIGIRKNSSTLPVAMPEQTYEPPAMVLAGSWCVCVSFRG